MKAILFTTISALLAVAPSQAALLLQSPTLGSGQESVYWEFYGGSGDNRGLSNGNAAGTPASGTGTIAPVAPGYRASVGFYSFMGSFGLTATTEVTTLSDIQNVVFQRVSMANPDLSIEQNLNWDGNAVGGIGAAPAVTLGGPWLSYYDSNDVLLGKVQATAAAVMASSLGVSLGGFSGDLYDFTYQWDLSGVTEDVKSVRIDAPIIVHSATVEARIDISGNYVEVVPEPSTGLLSVGLAGLLIRRRRC